MGTDLKTSGRDGRPEENAVLWALESTPGTLGGVSSVGAGVALIKVVERRLTAINS
jgi:hypothetical protein